MEMGSIPVSLGETRVHLGIEFMKDVAGVVS